MQHFNVLGRTIPRHDAVQQVTGKVIYGEDLYRPGMLFACALYSKYAHARVLKVDTSGAESIPGVRGVITARDVPGNRYGITHKDQSVLADEKVRHKGDAIAVVAADSLKIAREAVRHIKVDYEPLPAVFDVLDAMREDSPVIHANGNIAARIKIISGDVNKAFADSDLIVEENFSTQKVEHCHIEPHVALAEIENDGKLVIWTSNSRPFAYATQLTGILNIPMNRYQIKTPAVGGGFGGKNEITIEPWVALLALKTKRPVRMVFTREEEFTVSTVRHPYLMKYKSGVMKDGAIVARRIELISDSGAYVALGKETLTKAAVHSAGPYQIPNVQIDARLVYTNNITGGAMRGFGVPQVCFAHEVHTDSIAQKIGMDPVEFRIKNLFGANGLMPSGQMVRSIPLLDTLKRAVELCSSLKQGGGNA